MFNHRVCPSAQARQNPLQTLNMNIFCAAHPTQESTTWWMKNRSVHRTHTRSNRVNKNRAVGAGGKGRKLKIYHDLRNHHKSVERKERETCCERGRKEEWASGGAGLRRRLPAWPLSS